MLLRIPIIILIVGMLMVTACGYGDGNAQGKVEDALNQLSDCHELILRNDERTKLCFCDLNDKQIDTISKQLSKIPADQVGEARIVSTHSSNWVFFRTQSVNVTVGGFIIKLEYVNGRWCIKSALYK